MTLAIRPGAVCRSQRSTQSCARFGSSLDLFQLERSKFDFVWRPLSPGACAPKIYPREMSQHTTIGARTFHNHSTNRSASKRRRAAEGLQLYRIQKLHTSPAKGATRSAASRLCPQHDDSPRDYPRAVRLSSSSCMCH